MTYAVEFHNVSRLYGDVRAVDGVSIVINDGEFFSMLRPSGSGKTTCLRLIAGFEQLPDGAITISGEQTSELSPWERDVNMIFQNYALFLYMSIFDNVVYGLMIKGIDKKQHHTRACETLDKAVLSFMHKRKPPQLSDGQRQCAAVARALVSESRVLLLDEPFGALDLKLHKQMQLELKKLQQSFGTTLIFVIHDQGEALSMSDRAVVLNSGRIGQVDSSRELYMRPRTPFVASLVGTPDVFNATMSTSVRGLQGMFSLCPERIRLNDIGEEVQVTGVIQAMQYQGAAARFELKLAGREKLLASQANLTREMLPSTSSPGRQVVASWSYDAMVPLVEER